MKPAKKQEKDCFEVARDRANLRFASFKQVVQKLARDIEKAEFKPIVPPPRAC